MPPLKWWAVFQSFLAGRKLSTPVLVLASCLLAGAAHAQKPLPADEQRFEFTQPQMGVPFRIVLYASDTKQAEACARAAFKQIEELNAILSDYEFDSELSALSRTSGQGLAVRVSDDLWAVLSQAQQLARRTDGAFDVTIGPSVNLWRRARRQKKLPDPKLLAETRKAVGYQKMILDPRKHTVQLREPGMRLDLGGIAKGYAVDQALQTLRALGISRALVAGAGDLAVSNPPPGKKGWRIDLISLDVTNAPPPQAVWLTHQAIATSGDLFQRLEIDGKRYSHILDPRTGIGLTDHSLVTVIAPNCTTADSLATAVSVLGPKRGLKLISSTAQTAARILRMPDNQIQIYESKRFRSFVIPTVASASDLYHYP